MTNIEKAILPVLEQMEVELVLATFVKEHGDKVLRLMIERKGSTPEGGSGVDLALCADVSRKVSAVLDVSDVIVADSYRLEVSSPGIERPLVNLKDFERFVGMKAVVVTKGPVDGCRKFRGTLCGIRDNTVKLEISSDKHVAIPNELIKKANLVFDAKV